MLTTCNLEKNIYYKRLKITIWKPALIKIQKFNLWKTVYRWKLHLIDSVIKRIKSNLYWSFFSEDIYVDRRIKELKDWDKTRPDI